MKSSGMLQPYLIDAIKWLYWIPLRRILPIKSPHHLDITGKILAKLYSMTSPDRVRLLKDELKRSFGDRYSESGYERIVQMSFENGFRVLTEDFLFHRLDESNIENFIILEGRENLDRVIERGKGVVLVYLHFGSIMLMIASLGYAGYRYTQFAARDAPPPAVVERSRSARATFIKKNYLKVKEEFENRLPAQFIPLGRGVISLINALKNNRIVGVALDGRGGNRFLPVRFLGRWSLFTPGPVKLAGMTGAGIVPAVILIRGDRRSELKILKEVEPVLSPDGTPDLYQTLHNIIRVFEPYIERYPHLYGWRLLHCRLRSDWDDHPFFIDYAKDDSFKKYLPPGFEI